MKKIALHVTLFCFFWSMVPVSSVFAGGENYEEAMRLFAAIEYRKAEPLFLKSLSGGNLSSAEIVKSRECLAEIYVGMGQTGKAVEQYTHLLEDNRSYTISSQASPPMRQAYKQARAILPLVVVKEEPEKGTPKKGDSGKIRTAAWICTGVAVAGIGTGAVFYVRSQDYHDSYTEADTEDDANDARSGGQTAQSISQAGFAVGIVSGAAATYFFLSGKDSSKSAWLGNINLVYSKKDDVNQAAVLYRW